MTNQHYQSSLHIQNQENSMHQNDCKEDIVERASNKLKAIILANQQMEQQILALRNDPSYFVNPMRNDLRNKINEIYEENIKLRRMINPQKIPVYSQIKRNQNIANQNMPRESMKSSVKQSLRSSISGRSALSQVNSNRNYDKNEVASTCFNQIQEVQVQSNPVLKLKKLSPTQEQQRHQIQQQIRYLIGKSDIFEQTLQKLEQKQQSQCQNMQIRRSAKEAQMIKIQQYKKKLLKLLNKLKSREIQMDEMVIMYRNLQKDTIDKLNQSIEALAALQSTQVDSQVDEKYSQYLQLQQQLHIIEAEIQDIDEEKWFERVLRQLSIIFERLRIPIPKFQTIRAGIDLMCQVLIGNYLESKNQNQQRLNRLKQYYDQEKQNNQRILTTLKSKQHILGKKLNNLQIKKQSISKK